MPVKSWLVGDVLTAADMNAWTVPLAAVKPSDTGRSSNTTVTNDPDLQVAVLASATYDVRATIRYKGGTNGASDGQVTINAPGGATGFGIAIRLIVSGLTLGYVDFALGSAVNFGTNGTGTTLQLLLSGSVTTSGAGTLAVAWAQNTSNGTATTLMAGSLLAARKIG